MYRDSFAYHDVIHINSPEAPAISLSSGMLICTTREDSVRQYEWFMNKQGLSSETSNTCQLMGPGEYTVRVRYANNCRAVSAPFVYTGALAANEQVTDNHTLLVVPNPGSGDFDIHLPTEMKSRQVQIVLMDFAGRVVEKKLVECGEGREPLQVRGIAKGVYFLVVDGAGMVLREKVVVQ